jgi:hypothetical protein
MNTCWIPLVRIELIPILEQLICDSILFVIPDPTWPEEQMETEIMKRLHETKSVYQMLKAEVTAIDKRSKRFAKKKEQGNG